MDQLEKNIAEADQTLQRIIREARQRRDKQRPEVSALPAQTTALRLMWQKGWIDAHWPIAWPHWPPGLRAKVVALAQKVIRRLLAWYVNPIVRQQNEFNQATLDVVQILSKEISDLRAGRLQDRAEQQARLDRLAAQVEALRQVLQKQEQ